MSCAQLPPNRRLYLVHQSRTKRNPRLHHQEKHDGLVRVLRAPLPHADGVRDAGREEGLDDVVDLRAAEADARRIEHAVGAAEEEDLARDGVDQDEVAVGPYICVIECRIRKKHQLSGRKGPIGQGGKAQGRRDRLERAKGYKSGRKEGYKIGVEGTMDKARLGKGDGEKPDTEGAMDRWQIGRNDRRREGNSPSYFPK